MQAQPPELIYTHDPMCSWCWGFRPTWDRLRESLPPDLEVRRLVGGLAPDTDQPMPAAMRQRLQDTWRSIQERIPGTEFNFDFWSSNTPRRSTYPACRAVLAARSIDRQAEEPMIRAIQRAYYLRALNPSDAGVLADLAVETGLDRDQFTTALASPEIEAEFRVELNEARGLGMNSFPSLMLRDHQGRYWPVAINYTHHQPMLERISELLMAD